MAVRPLALYPILFMLLACFGTQVQAPPAGAATIHPRALTGASSLIGEQAREWHRSAEPGAGQAPISFVPNVGQSDPSVQFQAQGAGGAMSFKSGEIVMTFDSPTGDAARFRPMQAGPDRQGVTKNQSSTRNGRGLTISQRFAGANPAAVIVPAEPLPGVANYFIGNDPTRWRSNIPTYAGLQYRDLYAGIDLYINSSVPSMLRKTFVVAAGADPRLIRWGYAGATAARANPVNGALQIELAADENGATLAESAAVAWQVVGGARVPVTIDYHIATDGSTGFALGSYDPHKDLEIEIGLPSDQIAAQDDPPQSLIFASYLGGKEGDVATAITADAAGNSYIAGVTASVDLPMIAAQQREWKCANEDDEYVPTVGFVAKFNPKGNALLYSTYLGGGCGDEINGIAVDLHGSVYVTGPTRSDNFPTVNAIQGAGNLGQPGTCEPLPGMLCWSDTFVAKLSPTGSELIYSTYLGGTGSDVGYDIAVDDEGYAYPAGVTDSLDLPVVNAYKGAMPDGEFDAFVGKIAPNGDSYVYLTYFGGSATDQGLGVAADKKGYAYLTGYTDSPDFPTANALQSQRPPADWAAFVAKFDPEGKSLVYSTYLGGQDNSFGYDIDADAEGKAYLTGATEAANFPTTDAYDRSIAQQDAFVTSFAVSGTLEYSTYLGSGGDDAGNAIAVDARGFAYITGITDAGNFPVIDAAQSQFGGARYDAFVSKLDQRGKKLLYSTYIGGSGNEAGGGIATDGKSGIYVTGATDSFDFPVTPGVFQTAHRPDDGCRVNGCTNDAFAVRLNTLPWTMLYYLAADSNLSVVSDNTINQLERASDNPNVRVVVLWDGPGPNDSAYYVLQPDDDLTKLATYTDTVNRFPQQEVNTGAPETLVEFIQWARDTYPAERYALVMDDHGTGINGSMIDETSGRDFLTVREMDQALATATESGAEKIDVLVMVACLMGMIEDGYQWRNWVDYYVASEQLLVAPDGYDAAFHYTTGITETMAPQAAARLFLDSQANALPVLPYTLSVADLSQANEVAAATYALGAVLTDGMSTGAVTLTLALEQVQRFDDNGNYDIDEYDQYIDLFHFAALVKAYNVGAGVQAAAQRVMSAVQRYIIHERHQSGQVNSWDWNLDNARGVSIFFPRQPSSFYNGANLDFAAGIVWPPRQSSLAAVETNGWGTMLIRYLQMNAPTAPDQPAPPLLPRVIIGETGGTLQIYLPFVARGT